MKEQLLKTCKRLNKFTLEELEVITETDKSELVPVLEEFVLQKYLVPRNGIYFYTQIKPTADIKFPRFFENNSDETVDMIIKCFCADISSNKTVLLTGVNLTCIAKFYTSFRQLIFEKQLDDLRRNYEFASLKVHTRLFFDMPFNFYTYGKKVFVATEAFLRNQSLECADEEYCTEFQQVYNLVVHDREGHRFRVNTEHRIAELIWRRDKPFECLLSELKELLNA